jgi:hypothetical protein
MILNEWQADSQGTTLPLPAANATGSDILPLSDSEAEDPPEEAVPHLFKHKRITSKNTN